MDEGKAKPPTEASMQRLRHRQNELGNRRIELGAVLGGHLIAALHGADRRCQVAAAGGRPRRGRELLAPNRRRR